MKRRRQSRALLPAFVLGGLLLVGALGASTAAAATETITKSGPANATAGQNIGYTITVNNTSGGDDHNVTVMDILPAKVTYVSDTGGCNTGALPTLSCNLGTITDGSQKSFVITVKVKPDSTGTFSNQASVDGDDTDSISSNTVNTTIDTTADLGVTKNCVPSTPIAAGSTGTCTITIHNNGPSDAANVKLTDTITASDNITSATATPDGGGSCGAGLVPAPPTKSSTLTCTWTSVPANGNVKVDVVFGSDTSNTVSDSASVSADTSDSNSNNNTASDQLGFAGPVADLTVTKSCKPESSSVPVGGTGTCFIEIHNTGTSAAANVTVQDHIFSNGLFTVQTVTPGSPTCTPAAPIGPTKDVTINCALGTIPAGGDAEVKVELSAQPGIDVNDHATVATTTPEPDTSDNQADGKLSFAADSADLQVTKVCKPDTSSVIAGSTGVCQLLVHNWGPTTAINLKLTDHLISNQPFTITNEQDTGGFACGLVIPVGPTTNTTVTCTTASLAPGGDAEVDLTIKSLSSSDVDDTATISSDTPDPTNANNTATAGLTFLLSADLQVSKTCKPDTSSQPAGTIGICQLLIHNWGESTATNVHLVDQIISNAAFTIEAIQQPGLVGICTPGVFPTPASNNQVVDCTLTSLDKNSTWEVDVKVKSLSSADVDDTAFVSSDVSDPNTGNNSTTGGLTFSASADLQVTKTAASSVIAGNQLTYTVIVHNNGPSTAQNVVVTDSLPPGVTFDSVVAGFPTAGSVTPPGGGPGGTLTWNVGDMASGASETLQFVVDVNPQTTASQVNTACASSQTSDPVNSNNCSSATTGVTVSAALDITKTHITDPVNAGSNLTYTIVVHNGGPSTATNVVVTDPLPSGTTFVSGVDGSNNVVCTQVVAGLVSCNLGTIDPGQSKTIFITVHVNSNVPAGQITNCARVSSPSDSTSPQEDCDPTNVSTLADLWIDKQGTAPAGNPSGALIYTITVHNSPGSAPDDTPTSGSGGPSDAKNVVVTDQLPLTSKSIVVQFLSPSCTYNAALNRVTCQTGTIPFGTNATYQIQIQIKGSKGTLTNTACITHSDTSDPEVNNCFIGSNDFDTVHNVVQGSTGKPKRP
jgi:uncharacterized repeat protein (TIGR01451 family)